MATLMAGSGNGSTSATNYNQNAYWEVDRLTASATSDSASAALFSQNSNALAIGLGRAGSHEIAHYLLQQNFDSPMIRGVMNDSFSGAEWFSNATQGSGRLPPLK